MKYCTILFAIVVILQLTINGFAANPQRCFNGLTKYSKSEIEKIYFMNFNEAVLTRPASRILSCYLEEIHNGDDSINQQLLDVYKKIEYYKQNDVSFSYKQLYELESLGLPYSLTQFLRSKIRAGKPMKRAVVTVQDVVRNEIEGSRDYKNYKRYIFSKYDSNNKNRGRKYSSYAKSNENINLNHSSTKNSTMCDFSKEYLDNLRTIVFGNSTLGMIA